MRSPKDMDVVQIEVTNVCVHQCSNCTRFCGHHRKPFFMEVDTFKQAVDSMQGFSHCVGIMGGEPTLHPEFERFVDHFVAAFPESRPHAAFTGPSDKFIKDIEDRNLRLKRDGIRGLWSSLGSKYLEYFEKIQDSFGYQCLNDHLNPSLHGAVLVTRKELGIPDAEWFKLRDACWVQNLWSASITPKGAFFCEIAAAFDMLLDGPGGWPVEPGWWKRQPADFADQLQWCELCSAALPVPKRDAREEVDDVSPWWRDKLAAIGGLKAKRGGIAVFDPQSYNPAAYSVTNHHRPYLSDPNQRLAKENRIIYPDPILPVFLFREQSAPTGIDFHAIVPEEADEGRQAYQQLAVTLPPGRRAWVLLCRDQAPPMDLIGRLAELVFNPGCLYVGEAWEFFNPHASALKKGADLFDLAASYAPDKVIKV